MATKKTRATAPKTKVAASKNSAATKKKPTTFQVDYMPQTDKQGEFIRKIQKNIVSFGIGCPGTGKTFLAIASALEAMSKGHISKILITRPTVSAGPEMGYLPGDENDKMGPWLVPIMDAFYKLMPKPLIDQMVAEEKIQIVSLSFARGRNFEDAYVIVDEAENLDRKSFYLMLTRICEGSKIIFCGDSSQIDLRNVRDSGLEDAVRKFEGMDDFAVTRFTLEDCRRSRIVKEVIKAYHPDVMS